MVAAEWNIDDALRVREEESLQRGRQEGRTEGARTAWEEFVSLMKQGYTVEQLERVTPQRHRQKIGKR
jgi:hypothetical protein